MRQQLIGYLLTAMLASLITFSYGANCYADRHIEVGLYGTTTTVLDNNFEFFAHNYLVLDTWGLDLRVEVIEIKKVLHLLPVISYRYGTSYGSPAMTEGYMDTDLQIRDVEFGLRMRGWLLPWLGAFAQAHTGFSHIKMNGTIESNGQQGMRDSYSCAKTKWNLGAIAGMELRISPAVLKRANVTRFNVGGEMGVGFMKRAKTNFNPNLEGGDEFSLDSVRTVDFGHIDFSGVVFQFGLTLSFL